VFKTCVQIAQTDDNGLAAYNAAQAVFGVQSSSELILQPPLHPANSMIICLISAVSRCQDATSSRRAKSVQTVCRQGRGVSTQLASLITNCGFRDAGAIPAASTFSEHASTGDRPRHNASKPSDSDGVVSHEEKAVIRQEATASGSSRPPRATESATGPLFDDPALATVVAAWPDLPDTVRASTLAMVTDCEVLNNSI
jgi:hypothetical protein